MQKLGIFVPTYNRAEVLLDTINSILNQDYKEFDLYIIDNKSTDNTIDLLSNLSDTRINIIQNSKNYGPAGSFNKSIDIALEKKYEYMCIFHSDDIYLQNIIFEELKILQTYNNVGACFSLMSSDLSKLENRNKVNSVDFFTKNRFLEFFIENGTPLYCPTFMCKTKFLHDMEHFSNQLVYFGDTEFYIRLAEKCEIALIKTPLAYYRKSEFQESFIQSDKIIELTEEHQYIDKLFRIHSFEKSTIMKYKRRASEEYLIYAIHSIKLRKDKQFIMKRIEISSNFYKFPILSRFGIFQRLIIGEHFDFVRILLKIKVILGL